jgi:hypothetical protein
MNAANAPGPTSLDEMIANRVVPTAPSQQIAAFTTAMHSSMRVDRDGHPALDPQMAAYIVQLANEIGRTDSKASGFDETSPAESRKMPAQVYIAEAYETTISQLGPEIDQKIAIARLGRLIAAALPGTAVGRARSPRLGDFIRHHWIIGVVVLVVGMIEYFVGIQWLERSRLAPDDSSAHLIALGIPLLSAAIAVVGATVVNGATVHNPKSPRTSRPIQVITFILGVLLYLGSLLGGGFLLSQGADVTDDQRKVVIFLVYIGFAIGGLLVIFASHLFELERDWEADQNAQADRRVAENRAVKPTTQQIIDSNIAVLEQYHDLYEVLLQAREGAIKSYVAGVRGGGGSTSTLAVWDSSSVEKSPLTVSVTWPEDLKTVIAELKTQIAPGAEA